jgi:Tol biopolymer transport system component
MAAASNGPCGSARAGNRRARESFAAICAIAVCAAVSLSPAPSSAGRGTTAVRPTGTLAVANSDDFRTVLLLSPATGAVSRVRVSDRLASPRVDLSPGGHRLAYVGLRGVWTAERNGAHARLVVPVGSGAFTPDWVTWSPTAGRLAFTRDGDLFIVTPRGKLQRMLLRGDTYAPDWSSSGTIVFVSNPLPTTGVGLIQSIRVSDRHVRSFVRGGHPDVSPDGSRIAFSARDGVWVRPVNDGVARRITSGGDNPEWSPDGRYIAFTRNVACGHAGCEGRVFIVPAAGGAPRPIGPHIFEIGPLSWSR